MKEIFMLGQAYEKEIMLGMMVLLLVLRQQPIRL